LWSNAGSLIDALGVSVPGEPFDHIDFRSRGRTTTRMRADVRGVPHMNVERGALLRALAGRLSGDCVRFGVDVASVTDLLADGADVVVAADGVASRLRPDAGRRQRTSEPWAVWQAVVPAAGDLIDPGGGALVVDPRQFFGVFRHPNNELCWFMENPSLPLDAEPTQVLADLRDHVDPLVAKAAAATPPEAFTQWLARDRWPSRDIVGDRVVAVGDAAHPMLPCIGQGACTSIEDGVVLAVSLRGRSVAAGLQRYRRRRLTLVRTRVATAHFACVLRRPSPLASAVAATPLGTPFAHGSAAWMRVINRANPRLVHAVSDAEARR
jgi:2-polyprenyl-6-methoxyphenol hydroxylase-like FAD-dependent oxidoreductase